MQKKAKGNLLTIISIRFQRVMIRVFQAIKDQKEFALAIEDCPGKGILFQMRKGKSLYDIIETFTDNYKLRLLKGYLKWNQEKKK